MPLVARLPTHGSILMGRTAARHFDNGAGLSNGSGLPIPNRFPRPAVPASLSGKQSIVLDEQKVRQNALERSITAQYTLSGRRGSVQMANSTTKYKNDGITGFIPEAVPGTLLAMALAGVAISLRNLLGFAWLSPIILAVLLGIGWNAVAGTPAWAAKGLRFSMRRLLRFAIVLLGLQLTLTQISEVGLSGILIVALTLAATFVFTSWVGGLMGVDRGLTQLIAAGTSICGASAVVATNTVARASDEDVAYAIACVTLYGTLAMVLFPVVAGFLEMEPHSYGLWVGASVHEVAQVVAAAFQGGEEAGRIGTVAKLTRVIFLAPVVIAIGMLAKSRMAQTGDAEAANVPFPWFVAGFVGMVALNSLIPIPPVAKEWIVWITSFLLATALAAVGLETRLGRLRAKGWRPLLLGFLAFLFIAICGLLLVAILA